MGVVEMNLIVLRVLRGEYSPHRVYMSDGVYFLWLAVCEAIRINEFGLNFRALEPHIFGLDSIRNTYSKIENLKAS
jgi:hypothetical protein